MEDNKEKDLGWSEGLGEGKVYNKSATTKAKNPDTNFKLESKEQLWADKGEAFKNKYGSTKAYDEFDNYYNNLKASYSQYKSDDFQSLNISGPTVFKSSAGFYSDPNITAVAINQIGEVKRANVHGATKQGFGSSEVINDYRNQAVDDKVYKLEDGTLVSGDKNILIDNEKYVNAEGRMVKGIYYDPAVANDPFYNGDNYMIAQYYGEPVPLGAEGVSSLDYYGFFDPTLESKTWLGAGVDGIYDSAVGLFSSLSSLGESIVGAAGGEGSELQEWFEGNTSMLNAAKTSTSKYAQDNMWSGENMFHMTGEIITQFALGAGIGALAGKTAGILGATAKNAGRIGTGTANFVMGVHGAGDMRESALQHGFSGAEASWLQLITAGSMIGLNKSFGLADDFIGAVNTAKLTSKTILKQVPYTAKVVKEAGSTLAEGGKKALKQRIASMSASAAATTRNFMVNGNQYIVSGLKESAEEVSELILEEVIKNTANALKYAFDDDGEIELGKGRFMSVTDEGYWEGIRDNALMSAVGGFVGGNMAQLGKALRGNPELAKNIPTMTKLILEGKDKDILDTINNEHKKGGLGPKDLSINRTKDGKSWEPADENNISMNDANKEVLMQQYTLIKALVDNLGGIETASKLLSMNPALAAKIEETTLASDIQALTTEYVDLKINNDFNITYTLKPDATEEQVEKFILDQQQIHEIPGEVAKVDPATIRRAVEIKKELADIKSGKKNEKYLSQLLNTGSILDPKSGKEAVKMSEIFGEDFVPNLMTASEYAATDRKQTAERNNLKSKENEVIVDRLKDDLSNIEEVEVLFDGSEKDKEINLKISELENEAVKEGTTEEDKVKIQEEIRVLRDTQAENHKAIKDAGIGHSPLSQAAKQKLKDKLEKYKPTPKVIKGIKDTILKEVTDSKVYSREVIAETAAYKSLAADNPKSAEAILDFMVSFYNTRLESQIDNAKTIDDLQSINIDEVIDVIDYINNNSEDEITSKTGGNLLAYIEKNDAKKVGKDLASQVTKGGKNDAYALNVGKRNVYFFNANVKNYIKSNAADYKKLEYLNSKISSSESTKITSIVREIGSYKEVVSNLEAKEPKFKEGPEADKEKKVKENTINNFNRIIRLLEKQVEKARDYENDPTNLSFFLSNFTGDHDGISDSSDLDVAILGIKNQIDEDTLPSGDSTFSDVELVQNTLNAVKARQAQISLLTGNLSVDEEGNFKRGTGLIDAIANMRERQAKISDNKDLNAMELLDENINKGTKGRTDHMFSNILFDPEEYSKLNRRSVFEKTGGKSDKRDFWDKTYDLFKGNNVSNSPLSTEERARLEEMDDILTSAFMVNHRLGEYEKRLNGFLEIAVAGSDSIGMIKVHKKSVADKVKEDMTLLGEAMDLIANGDISSAPVEVQEFYNYYRNVLPNTFDMADKSDETIFRDYAVIVKFASYLANLDDDAKKGIAKGLYNIFDSKDDMQGFMDVTTMLYHDLDAFDAVYKSMIESMDDMPSMAQKVSAYYVSAHMNSDVSNVISSMMIGREFKNTLTLYGIGGAGKSKMVMGVGAKIGQHLQAKKFGTENVKVLLASNHEDQIEVMTDGAAEMGLDNTKSVGSDNGVVLSTLLEMLQDNDNLDDVSTIIYDEATFIPVGPVSDIYGEKSEMDKILFNIDKINATRGDGKPKLKLVLMGDDKQNGAVSKEGKKANISLYDHVYGPKKLDYSFRSKVNQLNTVIKNIQTIPYKTKQGRGVTNIESEWGLINKDEVYNMYGGVNFVKPGDSAIPDAIANAEEHIKDFKEGGKKFTVGIASDDEIKTPELVEFIAKYPNNVKVFTHKGIQGQEFDYVIGFVNESTFGNSIQKPDVEALYGDTIATTISRAKYFALMINETGRILTSKTSDNVTQTSISYLKDLSDEMRVMINKMISSIDPLADSVIVTDAPVNPTIEEQEERSLDELLIEARQVRDYAIASLNELYNITDLTPHETLFKKIKGLDGRLEIKRPDGTKIIIEVSNGVTDRAYDENGVDLDVYEIDDQLVDIVNESDYTGLFIEYDEDFQDGTTTTLDVLSRPDSLDTLDSNEKAEYENEYNAIEAEYQETIQAINDQFKPVIYGPEMNIEDDLDDVDTGLADLREVVQLSMFTDEDFESTESNPVLPSIADLQVIEDEIVEGIENGTHSSEDLEDIYTQIVLKAKEEDYENTSEDTEEEEGVVDVFDSEDMSEPEKISAWEELLKKLEVDEGIISGYSNNTAQDHTGATGIDLDIKNLKQIFPGGNIEPRESYKAAQLEAMGLRRKKGHKNYTYDLVMHKIKGTNGEAIYLNLVVGTHVDTGNKVVISNVPMSILSKSKSIGGDIYSRTKELVDRNDGKPVTRKIDNIKNFIKDKGKGKIVKGAPQSLTEFFKTFEGDGLFVSKQVFINTNELSSWRGDSFLLYSYDDLNSFSRSNINKLLSRSALSYEDGEIFSRKALKNGLGIIRLNNKALPLQTLFRMYDPVNSKTKEFYDIVNSRQGHTEFVKAISQIAAILDANSKDSISSDTVNNILGRTEEHNLQFSTNGQKELLNTLKGLAKSNPEAFKEFTAFIKNMVNADSMEGHTGDPRTNRKGEVWPTFLPNKSILRFANGTVNPDGTPIKDGKDNYRFNMMEFFGAIKASNNPDGILDIFTKALSHSRKFKYGMYIKPNISRPGGKKSDNTVFTDLKNLPGLNDGYQINVADITTPPLYLDGRQIMDLIGIGTEDSQSSNPKTPRKPSDTEEKTSSVEKDILPGLDSIIDSIPNIPHDKLFIAYGDAMNTIKKAIAFVNKNEEGLSKAKVISTITILRQKEFIIQQAYKKANKANKKTPTTEDITKSSVDVMTDKVNNVVNTQEDLSPEMVEYRNGIVDLVTKLNTYLPFIITPKSKVAFDNLLTKSIDDTEIFLDKMMESGIITRGKLDELVASIKGVLDTLSHKVTVGSEIAWDMIQSNMAMDIPVESLPDINSNGLEGLLVQYHKAKVAGDVDAMKEIELKIEDYNPNKKGPSQEDIKAEIVEDTVETKEELKDKLYQLDLFAEDTGTDVSEDKKTVIKKYKDVKEVDEAIENGEDISEAVENLKDEDLKGKIKDVNTDTIDDNLSLQAIEGINSALSVLEEFLDLDLDLDAKANKVVSDFNKVSSKVKKKLDKLKRYTKNQGQKNMIDKMYEDKVNEVTDKLNAKIKEHLDNSEISNPYLASDTNKFPDFKNKSLGENISLSKGAVDIMNKLFETDAKDIWIRAINAELTEVNTENIKLKMDLIQELEKLGYNDLDAVDELIEFQEKKEEDNICK